MANKQIKDFDLKESIDGLEDLLIQDRDGITKRIKTSKLMGDLDLSNYYTKAEVDDLLADTDLSIDMADYYDKATIDNLLAKKANASHAHSYNDLTDKPTIPSTANLATKKELTDGLATKANKSEIPSLEGYATEIFVTNKIAEASLSGGEVDLSGLATKAELATKADKTAIPTKTSQLTNDSGFLTEHQNISSKADKTYVDNQLATKSNTDHTHSYNDLTDKPTIPSTTNLATKKELTDGLATKSDKVHTHDQYLTEHQDLSDYALKTELPTVPTKVSELANDSGFIKSIPSEYVTETELNTKGYLTKHQDISNLQEKTDDALNTTDKTVVGAINELFQSVNNGKNRLEAAIIDVGGTVSKSGSIATFDEIINAISELSYVPIALNSIKVLKDNWKFKLINNTADTSYSSTDEAQNIYDDSTWKSISTPHDWSIYNSFNSSSASTYEGGYLDGGDAWYRRKLNTLDLSKQKVYLYFDGIYMESDIYVNGVKVISNKWYNPFCVEITN